MTQAEIEKRLDQLVRRAKCNDEFADFVDHHNHPQIVAERARLRTAHGVVPFPDPPPAPQPASEGVRWFRDSDGCVREYPSRKYWLRYGTRDGVTTLSMRQCLDENCVELDGPPPHGKPIAAAKVTEPAPRERWFKWFNISTLIYRGDGISVWRSLDGKQEWSAGNMTLAEALEDMEANPDEIIELDPSTGKPLAAPATEGDGADSDGNPDAPSDRTRLTLYPSRMCEATRAAFNWISRHDGGAHGALFTRALSDACAEYAAHMTASLRAEVEKLKRRATDLQASWETETDACRLLTKERDELRAEVERLKKRIGEWHVQWSKVRDERDELSAKLEMIKAKPARRPARGKGRGVKRGK